MTHRSPRFRILPQLTAYAACVCLAFACAGASENENGGASTTGVVVECPSFEPARGSVCGLGGQVCAYANCTAPDYRDAHTFSCEGGAWQLTAEAACEDVPMTCPPSITRGAYCNLPEGFGPCSVVDACGAVRDTYCTNSVWEYGSGDAAVPGTGGAGTGPSTVATLVGTTLGTTTTGSRPDAQCPDVMPTYGAACCPSDHPAYCDYSESGSDAGIGTGPGSEAVSGAGFGATGVSAPPTLTCAACGSDMTWRFSTVCP